MTKTSRVRVGLLLVSGLLALLTGCVQHTSHSSSVVEYLYPGKQAVMETPTVPRLTLPLNVGIAFVPESSWHHEKVLTERDKMALMRNVSDHFKKFEFIKSIELIPSAYLKPEGSFTNLNQIKTMYGIDVIALLSFDQTQFTDEGLASISYLTLVGAYVVPGEKNDTHTMLDAAVYDIQSKKMLFRAPGISRIKSNATPINLQEKRRLDREQGFAEASVELIENLDLQLELFKEKLKENPEEYEIAHRPGSQGAGSFGPVSLILFGLLFGGFWYWQQRKNTV